MGGGGEDQRADADMIENSSTRLPRLLTDVLEKSVGGNRTFQAKLCPRRGRSIKTARVRLSSPVPVHSRDMSFEWAD